MNRHKKMIKRIANNCCNERIYRSTYRNSDLAENRFRNMFVQRVVRVLIELIERDRHELHADPAIPLRSAKRKQ